MKTRMFSAVEFLVLGCAWFAANCSAEPDSPTGVKQLESGPYTLVGPFVHDNLSVYLINGKESIGGRTYLTLQEALDQKAAIVHETGDVNELAIENVSPDKDVFVQSGDIVKGGRQDRTIAQDFICAPKSGKVPINAFCVESGRWHQRGQEQAALFGSSNNAVAGKSLKLAAKYQGNQGEVWKEVKSNQTKLSENAGQSVADARSSSSYELTLENKKIDETVQAYLKDLQKIVDGKADVIGYAFAINGKVNSAEVYGSHDLFLKLWPKLLKSSAVEAFAEVQKGKTFVAPSLEAIKACIEDAAKGKPESHNTTARVQLITQETRENVMFETRDQKAAAGWVHRSYLTKDESSEPGQAGYRARPDSNQINAPVVQENAPQQQQQIQRDKQEGTPGQQ